MGFCIDRVLRRRNGGERGCRGETRGELIEPLSFTVHFDHVASHCFYHLHSLALVVLQNLSAPSSFKSQLFSESTFTTSSCNT